MIRTTYCALAVAVTTFGCVHTAAQGALTPRDEVQLHLERKEYDAALPLLEELHRAAPSDLTIARQLTEAEVRTHRAESFIARLEKSDEGRPPAVTRYMLGLARFAGPAQADRAIADFEAAAALAPDEPEFHYRLGLALLESEQYTNALPPLQKARALAPDRHDLLLPLAKALHRTGDRKGAVETLRALVEAGPTPEEVRVARAIMNQIADPFAQIPQAARAKLDEGLLWLNDRDVPQQAIVAFEEILRDFPDLGEVHALLGLAWQKLDDAGRAMEELRRAIELLPEDGRCRLYLGLLYQSRQRPEQAATWFEQALELNPLLDDAWFALGDYALERHDLPKAHRAFRALSFLQPDSPAAHGKYALVLQYEGDFAAADRELHAVLDRDPENVEFMLRLGILHFEHQKAARTAAERATAAAEAEKWLRKVLEVQPQNAVASRALKQLHAP
ncbi:MAG: tetratricopeptide repeat protein [Myxococcaceae bacterium]|nr:tetratricopeptide repeat protein [Myxococcaceae bacterium]